MIQDLTIETKPTPLGDLLLVTDDKGVLYAADFADCENRLRRLLDLRHGAASYRLTPGRTTDAIGKTIDRYFAGDIGTIQTIPISKAGTAFQDKVWTALRGIRPGQTNTYADLAKSIGKPRAVRAVGHANAANPCCIIVPCHRLVGANGHLTGYSGGLERKRWLLDHEARHSSR